MVVVGHTSTCVVVATVGVEGGKNNRSADVDLSPTVKNF